MEHVVREMLHYEAKDIPLGYHDVEEEREWMMNSIKDRYKEEGIKEGEARGMTQGIEQGRISERNNNARNLLQLGVEPKIISQATGLSVATIMKL